jgi:hypothetical protein
MPQVAQYALEIFRKWSTEFDATSVSRMCEGESAGMKKWA